MNVLLGLVGVVFGAMLFLTGMADYNVIHDGLLFRHAHLYLMMVAAMGTGIPLLWWLERRQTRSLFGGVIRVSRDVIDRKHLYGGVMFGTGWAIAGTCPGAVAAMAASGKPWALVVMLGVTLGVTARDLQEKRARAPQGSPPRVVGTVAST